MKINNLIRYNNIKIKNLNPCTRLSCLCIEYLDFSKKQDIQLYNFCLKNSLKEKKYFNNLSYTDFYKQNIL